MPPGGDDHSFADRQRQIEQQTREQMTREQTQRETARRMEGQQGQQQKMFESGSRDQGKGGRQFEGDHRGGQPSDSQRGPRDMQRNENSGDEGNRGKGMPFGGGGPGGPGMMPGGECLGRVKSTLKRVQKKVTVPSEWLQLITDVEAVSAKIKALAGSEDAGEEFEDIMDSVADKAEDLCMLEPKLMALEQMNRMATRDATRELTRLKKDYGNSKKRAEKSGEDISAITAKIDAKIAAIATAIEMLKKAEPQGESELAKAIAEFRKADSDPADIQEIMELVRETVFERFGDVYDDFRLLEQVGQSAKMTAQAEREINKYSALADKFEKPNKKGVKKDVSELRRLITEMRALLAKAKQMMKDDADEEDIFEIHSEAEQLMNDADEEVAHLQGKKTSTDNFINGTSPVGAAGANLWASVRNWLDR